jgi:Flp pilus assembly protein TadB
MFQSILEYLSNFKEYQPQILAIAERAAYFAGGALFIAIIWKYTSHIKERSQNFDKYASKLESILKQKNPENVQTLANTVLYTQHLSQRINSKWNRSIGIMFFQFLCLFGLIWTATELQIPSCLIGGVYMVVALVVLFMTESICELYNLRMEKVRLEKIFEQPVIDDQISEILCNRKYTNN